MDKNMFYNQEHLRKILEGTQDQYMQRLGDGADKDNYPLEVLKRKEWVRQNKQKNAQSRNCNNRVDMIGSGNLFDSSKLETMIARENYFNRHNRPEPSKTELPSESRPSQSEPERPQNPSELSRPSGGYRDSLEQGWPAEPVPGQTQSRASKASNEHRMRGSLNAKHHNDKLFKKKASQRRSVGYAGMRAGEWSSNARSAERRQTGRSEHVQELQSDFAQEVGGR